jgi:hypothetical protein
MKHQDLITRINEGMDPFAQHGGTAGKCGGNEFGNGNQRVPDQRCIDNLFRTTRHSTNPVNKILMTSIDLINISASSLRFYYIFNKVALQNQESDEDR